jgi:hypothetical protein
MNANVSDNDVLPERSTPGCHPEYPTVECYWDVQRWTEHRFACGLDGASPDPRPEASAASSPAPGRGPQELAAAAGRLVCPPRRGTGSLRLASSCAQGEAIVGPRA